jgi:hypothetical protein
VPTLTPPLPHDGSPTPPPEHVCLGS